MQGTGSISAVPRTLMNPIQGFEESPYFAERNLRISGTTRDSAGNALANCSVILFDANTGTLVDRQTSGADGTYMLQVPFGLSQTQTTTFYIVSYKAGSPDVAGTTLNTLVGV